MQDGDPSEACFPYTAGMGTPSSSCQQRCTNSSGGNAFQKSTAVNGTVLRLEDEEQIQVAIMEAGPVQAAFSVWSDFMQYKSGVYQHISGLFEGGHSVKIVGWGVEPASGNNASVPYWIVANSWGTTWGEDGFFRMVRGVDECYLETNAIVGTPSV